MTAGNTVLFADDDAAIRTVLNQALTRAGYEVRPTGNLATMWHWVSRGEGDLLITDVVMPDDNAFDVMPKIKKLRPDLPIVVMSAQNTFMTAIRAARSRRISISAQAVRHLGGAVGRLARLGRRQGAGQWRRQIREPAESMPLVGRSPAMQDIYRALARLMQTDLTVMITGESRHRQGTGGARTARFRPPRNGPFVAINMAAIPRDLIEAEFFGHEKGAFTGATRALSGRFEQAEGGTLFLDEIGDMPMDAQTRLLRVLQEGEYTTVGGRTPIKANVRIVAATHRDLSQLIRQGLFREDLFYRLNVVPIRLPPLRERLDDIPDLVEPLPARRAARQRADQGGVAGRPAADAGLFLAGKRP